LSRKKRTSAAKAVKRTAIYGTAKALRQERLSHLAKSPHQPNRPFTARLKDVPFVKSVFPIGLKALTNLIGIFGAASAVPFVQRLFPQPV
jgi:hypothetical protein